MTDQPSTGVPRPAEAVPSSPPPPRDLVLDASVAIKWYVPESHSAEALRFMSPDSTHHVPAFFAAECANTIWKKVGQRHELSEDEGRAILAALGAYPWEVHAGPLEAIAYEYVLAVGRPKLALYDFVYLALAESLDCRLVTADRVFYDALAETPFAQRLLWVADLP